MVTTSNSDTELQALIFILQKLAYISAENSDDVSLAYQFLNVGDQLIGMSRGYIRREAVYIGDTLNESVQVVFGIASADSNDGLRQIRFDVKYSYPHKEIHTHVIQYKKIKNKKEELSNIRIFPNKSKPFSKE